MNSGTFSNIASQDSSGGRGERESYTEVAEAGAQRSKHGENAVERRVKIKIHRQTQDPPSQFEDGAPSVFFLIGTSEQSSS